MKGRYYIIIFDKNENGNIIRTDLFGFPNGTSFINIPIHINSEGNIIVTWAKNNAEKNMNLSGLTIIPTYETNKMSLTTIAKGLGISPKNITRENEKVNTFLVNIFKDYIPDFNLN